MRKVKRRSYLDFIYRLKKILKDDAKLLTIGYIENLNKKYPFQKIIIGKNKPKRILISAGIHGNEPAGVESIYSFLESGSYRKYLNDWEITILPCINPYGFENNTRENHENKDLNRLFKDQFPPLEIILTKSIFKPSYFNVTIELHEDSDSYGYYLFQKSNLSDNYKLGLEIIKEIKDVIPINLDQTIDKMSSEKGIIKIKDIGEMDWWPMAGYSLAMKSGQCLTLESPTKLAMRDRVRAHLTAIDKTLSYFS
jgi:murein peptide amidase A